MGLRRQLPYLHIGDFRAVFGHVIVHRHFQGVQALDLFIGKHDTSPQGARAAPHLWAQSDFYLLSILPQGVPAQFRAAQGRSVQQALHAAPSIDDPADDDGASPFIDPVKDQVAADNELAVLIL